MQLDGGASVVGAYQQVFLLMAIFPLLGILVAFTLRDQPSQ